MRHTWIAAAALVALAACSGITYGGGGGGGGGGGPAGNVTVGNVFYQSAHNGSQNPAVDTIAAGNTITWTWIAAGSHSILSTGSTSFPSSAAQSAANATYIVTFNTPGTYNYICGVHGSAMSGRIVVQ
jgi:plastocyanin